MPVEPSAAPFHDWNERIDGRVLPAQRLRPDRRRPRPGRGDREQLQPARLQRRADPGRVAGAARTRDLRPDASPRDRDAGTAIAQAYHHSILPARLAARPADRDPLGAGRLRAPLRASGRGDLAARVGGERRGAGGAGRGGRGLHDPRAAAGGRRRWSPVPAAWWEHPDGSGRRIALVFFDGPLSHDVAFGLAGTSVHALVDRAEAAVPDGGLVVVATDGETFGHHHPFTERAVAYALAVEAPQRGLGVGAIARWLERAPAHHDGDGPRERVELRPRRGPVAHRLRLLHGRAARAPTRRGGPRCAPPSTSCATHAAEVFERRGKGVLPRPVGGARRLRSGAARPRSTPEDFVAEHVLAATPTTVEALTLLELQRQVAAHVHELRLVLPRPGRASRPCRSCATRRGRSTCWPSWATTRPPRRFLDVLDQAEQQRAPRGDGRQVWAAPRRARPASGPSGSSPTSRCWSCSRARRRSPVVGGYEVTVEQHSYDERGVAALCAGRVRLVHRRTRRTRATSSSPRCTSAGSTWSAAAASRATRRRRQRSSTTCWRAGATATASPSVLRRASWTTSAPTSSGCRPRSRVPRAGSSNARRARLTDRFTAEFERLLADHRRSLAALAEAGYPLPAELRTPIELALARRLRDDLRGARRRRRPAGPAVGGPDRRRGGRGGRAARRCPAWRRGRAEALEPSPARAVAGGDERARSRPAPPVGAAAARRSGSAVRTRRRPGAGSTSVLLGRRRRRCSPSSGRELGLAVDRLGVPR